MLKVSKCCCLDLRVGCILIGVVGIILAITELIIGLNHEFGLMQWIIDARTWSLVLWLIRLILGLIANGCLLFSASYTQGIDYARSIMLL